MLAMLALIVLKGAMATGSFVLGTFSAEDCEVMALGENGLPDRNLNKQPDCSTFSCGCLNQLQLSGQIDVHMYSTFSTPCSLASLQ